MQACSEELSAAMEKALNRLAKWRMVLAGWQLGTRAKGDPECDAVRDHRESSLMLRAELNAVVQLLVEKNLIGSEEWAKQVTLEADLLSAEYEKRFPGFKAVDYGMEMDAKIAAQTMKGWKP
jgi:hypothetical protein